MKKIKVTFFCLLFMIASFNLSSISSYAEEAEYVNIADTDSVIAPRSDVIKWRYQIIDGIRYKRQFNYTKNIWIGKWKPC